MRDRVVVYHRRAVINHGPFKCHSQNKQGENS